MFDHLKRMLLENFPGRKKFAGVHSEIVDFGLGQGRSDFETGGVVGLRRGFQNRENAGLTPKDAVSGCTLRGGFDRLNLRYFFF
jgi:hypothetical protein